MRTVPFEKIVSEVERLCITAGCELPQDVLAALTAAAKKESNASAKNTLNQLLENAKIAQQKQIPICQDTGLAVVFIQLGSQVKIEPETKTIVDANIARRTS